MYSTPSIADKKKHFEPCTGFGRLLLSGKYSYRWDITVVNSWAQNRYGFQVSSSDLHSEVSKNRCSG